MGSAVRLVMVAAVAVGCSYQPPTGGAIADDDDDQPTPDAPMQQPDGTPACADTDGDGVCNEIDQCADGDDNADTDGDGIANACDDWPCGPKPNAPPAAVTVGNATWGATLTAVTLDGGDRLKVANANTNVALGFAFAIHDKSCQSNCIDQIEVGLVEGARQSCPFDQAVSKTNGATGVRATTIRTPQTPGQYDVRYGLGENTQCVTANHTNWWQGEPDADHTIAIICVP